jgi:Flp pilus assembly protein TadG
MKIHRHVMSRINDQSGVTAVVVAIVIPILIGITALAVDMGYVMTTKGCHLPGHDLRAAARLCQ